VFAVVLTFSALMLWLVYQKGRPACKIAAATVFETSIWGTELQGVTCHMGSHSVNCHLTQANTPSVTPARQAGTQFTFPGGNGMEG